MQRDHEFTVRLMDGSYVVKLFEGVELHRCGDVVVGSWAAFELESSGHDEDTVYQELLTRMRQCIGAPGSPEYGRFETYVRQHGRRLSDRESAARDVERLRALTTRWHVTDDEQYTVALWQDAELVYSDGRPTVSAFGVQRSDDRLVVAVQQLSKALNAECGTVDEPGPRFEEITEWVRHHGERVSAEVLAREEMEKQAYVAARDGLGPITPDDVHAESSTGVPLLVDFWADWCAPCRRVTPVLVDLAEQWAGRIKVRTIEVDRFDGVWERFGFQGIPAMLLFIDGTEVHRIIGFNGKRQLVAELEPHLR